MAVKKKEKKGDAEGFRGHTCGECAHQQPYLRFETLTVKDRKPTMGVCMFITDRKVLLSESACDKFRKRL